MEQISTEYIGNVLDMLNKSSLISCVQKQDDDFFDKQYGKLEKCTNCEKPE
jgi:hypothetical protein